jgi:aconitate hydratase
MSHGDSFGVRRPLNVDGATFEYFSLPVFAERTGYDISRLPFCLKILLENLLRREDGKSVVARDIEVLAKWAPEAEPHQEIAFYPARVVLQDFTGVPAVVDLTAMRDAMAALGGDPRKINPLFPSELVIDHSVQVDSYGHPNSLTLNAAREYERNRERYELLRWAQTAYERFKVVPPATGIVHQVNLEYLARVVFEEGGLLYPDTLVGTDSHTTMINGLGVLGWGVGGIEAEAAMLGEPISLLVPRVVGFRLHGALPEAATATDLVLTITRMLREHGVVGKFVEFFGSGLDDLSLESRATVANMSPEFGSTCAIFPIDRETLSYARLTGRSEAHLARIEAYARAQGLFRTAETPEPLYSELVDLDLSTLEPTIAGPKRPQDKTPLREAKHAWHKALSEQLKLPGVNPAPDAKASAKLDGHAFELGHGSVVIAAITSCTNTSNPQVMFGAGLLARNAIQKGLSVKPWVKTSLAPGSKVVTEYLQSSGLLSSLNELRFNLVGYGCTTCIGNSGPLPDPIHEAVAQEHLVVVSVLSGNRNFEGRINPDVRANYLASPPLVVAYALAGRMDIDFESEPLGQDSAGQNVFLRDIWPSPADVRHFALEHVTARGFREEYARVFDGDEAWRSLPVPKAERFAWDDESTYIRKPTFFENMPKQPPALTDIEGARALLVLGDMVTTDHISPAGSIAVDSPAGRYLTERGVAVRDFNSYGSRRGNHEVMVRGTFANVRLRNQLAPGTEGGVTRHLPEGEQMSVFDAAMRYQAERTPLIVLGGKEYGSGSSRDWAAKGTFLLGVRAVVAESFERIHRSNLIGMGVLPLELPRGETRASLGLSGEEVFSVRGVAEGLAVGKKLTLVAERAHGEFVTIEVRARIDTAIELEYYRHGGILPYVLRQLSR